VSEARRGPIDIDNLLDKLPSHLEFTSEEEDRGKAGLSAIGIKDNSPFVCLNVRDSAYLTQLYKGEIGNFHNYRDSDVQNYILAAEALADRGFFVIRMGQKVGAVLNSAHPKVIDYATNGMRSDFMDIYLGSKCLFAISTGSGWDEIPEMQRRPIVYVNFLPLGESHTSREEFLTITKKYVLQESQETLTLREIFTHGVGFCLDTLVYKSKGVELIENTPEEIRDVAIEMVERLAGTWQEHPDDKVLQQRFWEIFPTDAVNTNGVPMHGEIRSRFGADFLRNNKEWLN
jgi:putative glycosyltransferase (TIGR04372 family)